MYVPSPPTLCAHRVSLAGRPGADIPAGGRTLRQLGKTRSITAPLNTGQANPRFLRHCPFCPSSGRCPPQGDTWPGPSRPTKAHDEKQEGEERLRAKAESDNPPPPCSPAAKTATLVSASNCPPRPPPPCPPSPPTVAPPLYTETLPQTQPQPPSPPSPPSPSSSSSSSLSSSPSSSPPCPPPRLPTLQKGDGAKGEAARLRAQAKTADPSGPEARAQPPPAGYILHHLRHPPHPTPDTLASLSLSYGVPPSVLRAHNRIPPDADYLLAARHTILIPAAGPIASSSLSPAPVGDPASRARKTALRRFMVACREPDYDAARVYLDESGWDLDAAVGRYLEDAAWAREHPCPKPGPSPGRQRRGAWWVGWFKGLLGGR
ncbi:hypothetical protein VTJ83DRAFT_1028 [Remersonia thermophila]|uniref:LysM domain-containing protein n=1 Tax=Remersonia thermophila TaxID=72144 RepID=A0ABR4DMZ5_9PEZI